MTNGIRTFLGIGEQSAYVRAYLARVNMDTLYYQTIFIAFLSLITYATTFAPVLPWVERTPESIAAYRIGLALICLVNLIFHQISKRLRTQTETRKRAPQLTLYLYADITIAICIVLNVFDYATTGNFFMYVVALVLVFGLLCIPPLFTIGTLIIATPILVLALHAVGYSSFWIDATVSVYGFIVIIVSATNYHSRLRAARANDQAREASLRDELTGTMNRRALDKQADSLAGEPLAMLMGDIDEFKFYNDTFGHDSGDRILQEFARSMQEAFGADNVFRFGGDEFVAVARTSSSEEFEALIDTWRTGFTGIVIDGEAYHPTTSAGYVIATPETGADVLSMLRIADIGLYDAKEAGRNRVRGTVLDGTTPADFLADESNLSRHRVNHHDELTGLPTMVYFTSHAMTMIDAPALADAEFDVVYFNVENLKIYNDRFGFTGGDELLVFVARTIENVFERSLVARFGDDRFVMLALHDGLLEGLGRVHEAVRAFNPESNTVIRAGVYPYERGMDISAACDRAKLACDHIKGRYNVYYYIYEEALLEAFNRQQFILDRFDDALEQGHIEVYYQPIMRSIGPRICGFEALARWNDPDEGQMAPADFIPVLEEYRIIHRMDLHILKQICLNYRALMAEGLQPMPTNINLSRFDLELCDIMSEVCTIMDHHGVPHDMVNIEITESAFAKNRDLLRTVIEQFHERGFQVWMDDFGSGYSSLNVLREFSFDVVKIDLRFLRHQGETSRERARLMLPHMISMAKDLGIQTLAEGIEGEDQFEFLKGIGCEKLQGYYFGMPNDFAHMCGLLAGTDRPVEKLGMREYFDGIGRVNLLHPTKIDETLSHDIELSSGLPAAVIEFYEGRVRYLLWNSSYLDYLVDIGMNTIENSEAQMNDLTRVQAQGFFRIAEQYKGTAEWINLTFYEDDDLCTAMARCISVDPGTGAYSFVYIAFNLSKYLNRTGSSLPAIK